MDGGDGVLWGRVNGVCSQGWGQGAGGSPSPYPTCRFKAEINYLLLKVTS